MISNLTIRNLISDEQCYAQVRQLRWPEKICCPGCESEQVIKRGKDDTEAYRQRYECKACNKRFAGHHQPLKVWMLCLYFMGLNLSNAQIAKELDLNKDDVQNMVSQLRLDVFKKSPVFR